jgi:DNA-binding PadR family transcriptional regulator
MPPIDFNGLDTAVHGPIRLGILTAVQRDGHLDFTTLKKRLDVSDGALGLHLQKLEKTGYITCSKKIIGRRPRSTYRITLAGRKALAKYLDAMQAIINSVRGGGRGEKPR